MPVVHTANSRLLQSRLVAEGTFECSFERPFGFEFRAGQALDLTLLHPALSDREGDTRTFSIASPPAAKELTIATRLGESAFKRTLAAAQPGLEVRVEGPAGSFTLPRNRDREAVLLACGIGITPFLSMLRQEELDCSPRKLTLFYSNPRPEEAAYLEELDALQ